MREIQRMGEPLRVLVTGAAGYIGSHTAKALAELGAEPIGFDNLARGHRQAVRWGPLIEGDLLDTALVRQVLQDFGVEAVLHFAGHAYVGESMTAPGQYFRNNLTASLSLVNAMVETGVRTMVFSSTCATYGIPEGLPLSEQHPQQPVNPYGESKLMVERALRWYGQAYDLGWTALRYFNAAGADPAGELREAHDPETHLVPIVLEAASGRRHSVPIYGTDYPTADGTAVRDFVHVTDLAQAHILALAYLRGGGESRALNLGAGRGHSVLEVVRMAEAVTGVAIPVERHPRRAGDPPILIADPTQARELLGWVPTHSALRYILETAWAAGRIDRLSPALERLAH